MSYINLKNYFKIENILNFYKYKFKYMGNSQEQTDKLVFQTNQIHQTYVGYSQSFNSL